MFAEADVDRISILDPIFHADTVHAVRVLKQMSVLGVNAKISMQCRFEMVKPQLLDALDESFEQYRSSLSSADRL